MHHLIKAFSKPYRTYSIGLMFAVELPKSAAVTASVNTDTMIR